MAAITEVKHLGGDPLERAATKGFVAHTLSVSSLILDSLRRRPAQQRTVFVSCSLFPKLQQSDCSYGILLLP